MRQFTWWCAAILIASALTGSSPAQESGDDSAPASSASEVEPSSEATDSLSTLASEAKQDVTQAMDQAKRGDLTGVWTLGEKYVAPTLGALLGLIIAYFLAKLLSRMVRAPVEKKVDVTLGRFIGKLVFYSIMVFAVLGILGKFGISVASFAAVLAAAGFAIGLAFQGSLSNFASGILLLVFRPFKVGDVINAAGLTAKVTEIDLFTTVFDTPDNRRIIVPNSAIAGGIIENVTHHDQRRVDVQVGVEYSASLDDTRQALEAAARSLQEFLVEGEGRGYQIFLGDLGDSSVSWTVRFWTRASDFWVVKERLTQAVKEHLDQAGLAIPFPQMDVRIVKQES